ncbi:MAG: hypothetical protein GC206_07610 [Alphaproteobacteria bacterium]|nr:hypothetical protein [Alphaproteobacteria bacterium]
MAAKKANHMMIDLPEDLERFIRSEVRNGEFASESDAIAEAVRLFVRQRQESRSEAKAPEQVETDENAQRASRQRENLKRLCGKLDALPTTEMSDELTNRDHDQILYGR